jgi:hypothetical protein
MYIILKMELNTDIHMSNGKQYISNNLKVNIWYNYFGNRLEGICYHCKRPIIIPKTVKDKIHPKLNLYDYEDKISNPIYGTHYDHIISEYNEGITTETNLRPICIICNLSKSNKNEEDFVINVTNKNDLDFMDIDVEENKCKGIKILKNKQTLKCKNNSYFRGKCNSHLHQSTYY